MPEPVELMRLVAFVLIVGVAACLWLAARSLQPLPPSPAGAVDPVSGLPLASDASNRQATVGEETYSIRRWVAVEDFPSRLAVFETVFWEPDDTASMRERIRQTDLVRGKRVLEIGTGSGLIALCCLQAGAERVVATDVNRAAAANAVFNARGLQLAENLEVRLVPLDDAGAFSVIGEEERFDLILSNPPWEDDIPEGIDEFALYDPRFELLHSLLSGLRDHLTPGGRAWLAYGCKEAVVTIIELAPEHGLEVEILDDRELEDLPELFLPGMLLEVRPGDREGRGQQFSVFSFRFSAFGFQLSDSGRSSYLKTENRKPKTENRKLKTPSLNPQ
jgi:release factor glutamine methyltransferase